ncbi:MAG: Hsp70 family protein [Magnetococcales bacterium]|nr:Hsp70 family protein [Magnetococcales bacterium]
MNDIIIGIDLGTTNSEVAVFENGQPRLIGDSGGDPILPSFVGLSEDGVLLVGQSASNQYAAAPERSVKSVKRLMGQDTRIDLGGTNYAPQEISAIILKRLKEMAESDLGQPVNRAVITVPAYFSDAQRQATREAGTIAGLDVVRMINEPTAAALAYEAGHEGMRDILVYDLGGGTFDVSIVRMEQDVVEVIASHGDNHLGGDDFDQLITSHLLEQLETTHGVTLSPESPAHARLLRASEAAKRVLSEYPFVNIEEEFITEKDGVPVHLSLELSRDDYEEMIQELVERTLESVHATLDDAKLTPDAIQEILLVGGSTRTPLVRRRLEEIFHRSPRGEIHPDLCVALGAAIQGGIVKGEAASAVLVDVTPYTFGTSALGFLDGIETPFVYVPIIHRNTPIPVSRGQVFYTVQDDQKVVDVKVYQGENPDASHNILIGSFRIEGLSKAPANNPIVMTFDLDLNGVLHASAREKISGLERSITIDNAMTHFEAEEMDQARSRVEALFENEEVIDSTPQENIPQGQEDVTPAQRQQHTEARALVEKAERMLEEASDEDRDDMINLIEEILQALDKENFTALAEAREQLADILYYMET